MVTEDRLNRDHFQGPILPPRDHIFYFSFQPTCSAGLNLDLYMFSLGTLSLWSSEFGHQSAYIDQNLRNLN